MPILVWLVSLPLTLPRALFAHKYVPYSFFCFTFKTSPTATANGPLQAILPSSAILSSGFHFLIIFLLQLSWFE